MGGERSFLRGSAGHAAAGARRSLSSCCHSRQQRLAAAGRVRRFAKEPRDNDESQANPIGGDASVRRSAAALDPEEQKKEEE